MAKTRSFNYLAGISTGTVRMLLHVLVGVFLTPFTLHYLDREEFAVFSLTLELLTWLTLLDVGISAGLRIQAARLSGKPDQEKLNRMASTAFFAQNFIVLVVLLLGVGMAVAFPYFFPVRATLQHDATLLMVLSVLGAALSIGSQTFSALLIANQQMHVDNILGLLLIAIRTVLTITLLKFGCGVYSLAIAHLVSRFVTAIMAVVRTYRLIPGLQIKYHLASWEMFRQIGGLGIWFSLGGLAGIVIHSLDSTVTAKVVSVETVTSFLLTGRFYELAGGLVWLISENARPMLGQMFGQNKMGEGLTAYRQLFTFSTGLAVVAAFSVWSGNSSFVTKWVGPVNYTGKFTDLAMAFTMIAGLWIMPNRVVLSANLAVRAQCLVRLLEGALNLGLSIILGKMYGLIGIVVATFIASATTSMWLLPLFTARMFNRPFIRFVWDDAAKVLLLILCLFPVALVARGIATDFTGYLGAAAGAGLTGVCGLALVWFVMLDKSMRARLPIRNLYESAYARTLRVFTRPAAR
ncbi:MAG: Polysaccharide biosynthesis protein [Pedosphaera sp.]|nr:Polysaccharide biosynthesis protein [Pedosphaera sp.]